MRSFHKDKEQYFNIQYLTAKEYIIPFIEPFVDLNRPLNVLEIGCAEAGVLKAFLERGHRCLGIELQAHRVELAKKFLEEEYKAGKIDFLVKNIYDVDVDKDLDSKFDLIILKDVIEHIPDQGKFIVRVKDFLKPDGKIFFGFPPWQMPFGGHQQVCHSKILSFTPYFHLLPTPLYRGVLKLFKEPERAIKGLVEIKETGISIDRFEKVVKRGNFKVIRKKFFLFNPIYKYKFNLKPRDQASLISKIPIFRNFVTTCAYYLVV